MSVEAQCSSCRGTGLYSGFAEAKGTAVICTTCKGTGKQIIKYIPFTALQRRDDVQTVKVSAGFISYQSFFSGKWSG